ncbi:MAG TPA: acetyl-CoA hydrolase/transferase C-terminal domain-containing protein [Bacteroidia bacterium]|jgi:4-hydroxybutyrate CoA-transferase|nr:acetyl-CoA hydrolase/transferase C-terminal domain-containing protein [Bacteroidia bacterium]
MIKEIYSTAEEALSELKSGSHVFIQSAAAAPAELITAMVEKGKRLNDIQVYQMHTEGDAPYIDETMRGHFKTNCFFVGSNVRKALITGMADYIPVFLSEVPALFRKKIIPLDIALLHVSPPDKHGYCSLGISVDLAMSAIQNANCLIAQVNPQMPRTHGAGMIHMSKFRHLVSVNHPLPEAASGNPDNRDIQIAKYVAGLIEDRSTLQMGIGKIPNAVLGELINHKDLGIHSEMFSDGVIDLVERGVITGSYKKKHPGKMVAGFILGSRKLYDFVDDNPLIEMEDSAYVNDTHIIRQNPRVVAINSAIEIDLSGQICADSIGPVMYSGVGGQMDFIRGASLSEGGKPIIALHSTTSKGESRIVNMLHPGSGVVTTRAHVHYVITEYGIANLYGRCRKDRAKMLIEIAHPDHREKLEKESYALLRV